MKTIKDATNFDELLDIKYGKLGTEKRDEFEIKAKSFVVGEMIKEERKKSSFNTRWPGKKNGNKKKLYLTFGKWKNWYSNFYVV